MLILELRWERGWWWTIYCSNKTESAILISVVRSLLPKDLPFQNALLQVNVKCQTYYYRCMQTFMVANNFLSHAKMLLFFLFFTHSNSWRCINVKFLVKRSEKMFVNQLLQLCTAPTAWSESDQAVRTVHTCSCNSWWLALLWSDSVIKLVSVLFGKCSTLVVTKCWPMVFRQPCGDQWKAEKSGAF